MVCRNKHNIDDSEDALTALITEAHPTAGDTLERTHVDEGETVPAEPIKDLIQDKHLGIQAKEMLNSKMRTSTRPGTGRPVSRSDVRKPDKNLATYAQHEYRPKTTNSTACIFSKAHSMMTDTEKDVKTDDTITLNEHHSQERVKKQMDVHRLGRDAGLHEQIHEDDALCHKFPRGSLTNIR